MIPFLIQKLCILLEMQKAKKAEGRSQNKYINKGRKYYIFKISYLKFSCNNIKTTNITNEKFQGQLFCDSFYVLY